MPGRQGPWGTRISGLLAASLLVSICLMPMASASSLVYVITREDMEVFVQEDGTADIQYTFHITVRPQSMTVNGFKVHMPNWRYDDGDLSASIDGKAILGVHKSRSDETIVVISFNGAEAMQPGTNHIFMMVASIDAMVVKHPSDPDMAQIKARPTWWNPDQVQEVQFLEVRVHLPEGYLDEGSIEHTAGATVNEIGERLVLAWNDTDLPADFKRSYKVGLSASVFDKVFDPFWDIQLHDYELWIVLAVVSIVIVLVVVAVRRLLRKPYIKPFLKVEAWGPRKGFGPMEAAIVLGLAKERVAAMFLLDLVMVGAIEVKDPKAMEVVIHNQEYEGRSTQMFSCIRKGHMDPIATSLMVDHLKEEVEARLEGFDREATMTHYKAQAPKRWKRYRPTKAVNVDELLWLMTDPDAKGRFKGTLPKDVPDWTSWRIKV